MARSDTLYFQILGCVACKFKYFCCKVFEYRCNIDGSWRMLTEKLGGVLRRCTFGTNAHLVLGSVLQETLDTTTGKLSRQKFISYLVA